MKKLKQQLAAKIAKLRKLEKKGSPYNEILPIYKQIKELQYKALLPGARANSPERKRENPAP